MRSERAGHTLQTTALVHEAYLRLIDARRVQWQNRTHFFGIAAQLMRRILVDFAREQNRPIAAIINSHWHLDHVGGNPRLRAEFPGILASLVQGCLDWQQHGLNPPSEVLVATEKYRDEMDVLGDFFAERCVQNPTAKAKAGDLYREYTAWSQGRGDEPLSQRMFGVCLGERGFQRDKDSKGMRWWHGVGLKEG